MARDDDSIGVAAMTAAGRAAADADMRAFADVAIGRYTWCVACVTALLAGAIVVLGPVDELLAIAVMVVLVAFVGIPHGSYDLEVARRLLAHRAGRAWWLWFGSAYLLLAAIALGLWVAVPVVGLVLLLLLGAVHWGCDDLEFDVRRRWLRVWLGLSRGCVSVAAPVLFYPIEATYIFGVLTSGAVADAELIALLARVSMAAAVPGIVAAVFLVWRRVGALPAVRSVVETVTLLVWFACVPPVLAFAVYFCLWHSVRHSMRSAWAHASSASMWRDALSYGRAVVGPTVLTWVLCGGAWWAWQGDAVASDAAVRIVFVGLFALTIPHVVLEALVDAGKLGAA